jgi:hypothetical protein
LFFLSLLYKDLENIAEIISESSIVISWTHLPFELASLRTFLFIIISKNQFLKLISLIKYFPFFLCLYLRNPHTSLSPPLNNAMYVFINNLLYKQFYHKIIFYPYLIQRKRYHKQFLNSCRIIYSSKK